MLGIETEHLIKLILHNGQVTFWFLQVNTYLPYPLARNTETFILHENRTTKSNFIPWTQQGITREKSNLIQEWIFQHYRSMMSASLIL